MRRRGGRLAAVVALVCWGGTACSRSAAPTAPSATAASGTRVIGLVGNLAFGNVVVRTTADASLTITNSGTATLTVSNLTLPAGYSASWRSGTIAAGNSQAVTIRFLPTAAQTYNGAIVVVGDQTGGTNGIAVSGTGFVPQPVTIRGTIRDGTSGGVLPGISVEIAEGSGSGTIVTSNAAGAYSLTVAPGSFRLFFFAENYGTEVRELTASADTQFDVVLRRSPLRAPQPTGPAPPLPPNTPAPPNARTFLSFVSDPGELIGQGQSRTYHLSDGNWGWGFSVNPFTGAQEISAGFNNSTASSGSSVWWDLDLAAPVGRTLGVGTYEGASRYPYQPPSQPGLRFFGSGHDCETITGRFTITAISVGPGDWLNYLEATFEQHCNGDSKALRGELVIVASPR